MERTSADSEWVRLSIGEARGEDRSGIAGLLRANEWGTEDLDRGEWFVARARDDIIGAVRITDVDADTGYFDDVLVTEGRRGAGIGAALMRDALEQRDATFYLVCHDPRIAFYERLGFERIEGEDVPEAVRGHAYATKDLPSVPEHVHRLMRRGRADGRP